MTPHDLLAAFETLAEAPDGIARLRELVLQLAVRGKLAPQDPTDGLACILLERIAAQKERLVEEGKIPKPMPLLPLGEDEVPFAVPAGWVWCRAEHLFEFVTSGSRGWAKFYSKDGPVFLRIGNLDYGTTRLDLSNIQHVQPPANSEGTRTRTMIGDILVSTTGDTRMVGLIPDGIGESYINQHIAMCRPLTGTCPSYIAMAFTSPPLLNQLWGYQRGVKNSLGLDDIRVLQFPLPPLPEQHRIVAKVDALMALLDRLEVARSERETARAASRDVALAALRDAPDADTVQVGWTRIAEHMDDLFTDPADVAPLRQTILQLAVRGKLVPQDPSDEPACALLEHIATGQPNVNATSLSELLLPLPPLAEQHRIVAKVDALMALCDALEIRLAAAREAQAALVAAAVHHLDV